MEGRNAAEADLRLGSGRHVLAVSSVLVRLGVVTGCCAAWCVVAGCEDAGPADGASGGAGAPAEGSWSIEFRVVDGDVPVSCGEAWDDVGLTDASVELRALSFFVHDLELILAEGAREPLVLIPDGARQNEEVALLDFDDGMAGCSASSAETNRFIRVRAPSAENVVGLAFTVGVPRALNHLDLGSAEPPLDISEMYWSWQGGYKYLRLEIGTDAHPEGYVVHLGSTECDGSPAAGYECGSDNLARIELLGDPAGGVVVDVGELLAGVDVDRVPDGVSDVVAGCMSNPADPECVGPYDSLGLAFGASPAPPSEQRVFGLP